MACDSTALTLPTCPDRVDPEGGNAWCSPGRRGLGMGLRGWSRGSVCGPLRQPTSVMQDKEMSGFNCLSPGLSYNITLL